MEQIHIPNRSLWGGGAGGVNPTQESLRETGANKRKQLAANNT